MGLSPIVLFVYNRPWHTLQTVVSLQANELAERSDLFIYADGPKSTDDAAMVAEVRAYLRTIKGFAKVTIIERKQNLGLAASIISGVTEIVNTYGSVIVLEDDLVSSPYFLQFMNDALTLYSETEQVINVHGYMYPVKATLPETFFLRDTGSWGWGTWERGWRLFEPDGRILLQELESRKQCRAFNMDGAYNFTGLLREHVKGELDSWAILWQASAFLQNRLTLFPGRSLISNIGLDSSGVHCATTTYFDTTVAQSPIELRQIPIEENLDVLQHLKNYFRVGGHNPTNRLLGLIRRFVGRLTDRTPHGRSRWRP